MTEYTKITIPQRDANSESATVIDINKPNYSKVSEGEVLFVLETSKATFDYAAERNGIVVYTFEVGDDLNFNEPVGYITDSEEQARNLIKKVTSESIENDKSLKRLTENAKLLVKNHNIDVSKLDKKGIITEKDIVTFLSGEGKEDESYLEIDEYPEGLKRVLILTGGRAAHQIIDIFTEYYNVRVIGILDDKSDLIGKKISGINIIGKIDEIISLWNEDKFTHAIVGISSDIEVRKRLFEKCANIGIPMVNAIDKSCNIRTNVSIGMGNVICGNTYIGSYTQIGDNNFISSNSSIEHHNIWHSHISIGPNCVTSGRVEIGDECRLGMGVMIEPGVVLGSKSVIASGITLSEDVKNNSILKRKIEYTT